MVRAVQKCLGVADSGFEDVVGEPAIGDKARCCRDATSPVISPIASV